MNKKLNQIKWLGCWISIGSAILLAFNIPDVSQYAFIGYLVGSIMWIYIGIAMNEKSLVYMNIVYTVINVIAIISWIVIPHVSS